MIYKIIVNGEAIEYGPHVTRSRFSDEEWNAIHIEMIKSVYSDQFKDKLKDKDFVHFAGECIDLSDRYEALLELLPQSSFSKAGTHPSWVAKEVEENTLRKDITRDDIKMFIDESESLEELKIDLIDYFGIKEEGD